MTREQKIKKILKLIYSLSKEITDICPRHKNNCEKCPYSWGTKDTGNMYPPNPIRCVFDELSFSSVAERLKFKLEQIQEAKKK